jgi:DNA-nicking Smr family endonuclease
MAKDQLDLHGKTKDEVFDLVDRFIMKAQSANLSRAKIMTGKGKGIVHSETIRYLKLGGYNYAYEKTKDGKVNEGLLIVFL